MKMNTKEDIKYIHDNNPIVKKLLKLMYRMDTWFKTYGEDVKDDTTYVKTLIQDIRKHKFTKLAPEDGHCCNGLWRRYDIKQ